MNRKNVKEHVSTTFLKR